MSEFINDVVQMPYDPELAKESVVKIAAALNAERNGNTDINKTLDERGKRYGKFIGHAEVAQGLKEFIQVELFKREKTLAPDQQEALDMICHKIARIVNGDADYDDSWIDIAGYATLVAERLRGNAV